jgi:pimeloyl-ACP methyl ester carboxylesterase
MARFVLVHGAFGGAWCWDPVVGLLEEAGHTVERFDLPGSGEDQTPVADVSLSAYAERVCAALAEGSEPAILVGHSMGGVAVTQAAARCPERVASLVYVAAFLPADGQSLLELTQLPEGEGDQVQANMVVEGDPPVATLPAAAARGAVFGRCSDQQAAWGIERLRPQPVAPFTAPVELNNRFDEIPKAYVLCTQDRAIPPALQRRVLTRAGCDDVTELDADHAPWLSETDELAAALNGVAARRESVPK